MKKDKSSISNVDNYKEAGEFWDNHDLGNYWSQTKPARFNVDIQKETTYYPVDNKLSERICTIARKRGISAGTLLNLWVQERLQKAKS